jgi:hypothetical protein
MPREAGPVNRTVIAVVLLIAAGQVYSQQLRMELRLLESGKTAMVDATVDQGTGEIFFVSKEGLKFYDTDISSVRVVTDQFGTRVDISFTARIAEKLYQLTANSIDRRMGILVGGKLVFHGTITEPLRDALTLYGLQPERARNVALSIGGGKLSPKGPMTKAVFVGTETEETEQSRALSYVVMPTQQNLQENTEAASMVTDAMASAGYRMLAIADLKKTDLSKVGFINVTVGDLKYERVTVEITVGRFRGRVENRDVIMMWRGVFGLDTEFYTKFKRAILSRAIGHYGQSDIQTTEQW